MQEEADSRDLNDLAGFGSRNRSFKHCLMRLRIEFIADFR